MIFGGPGHSFSLPNVREYYEKEVKNWKLRFFNKILMVLWDGGYASHTHKNAIKYSNKESIVN